MSEQLTIGNLCEQFGVRPDAVRQRWNRHIKSVSGKPFASDHIPTEQEYEILFANKPAKVSSNTEPRTKTNRAVVRPNEPRVSVQTAPSPNAAAGQSFAVAEVQESKAPLIGSLLDLILFGVVFGHAVLIAVECLQIWGTPGGIGGGVALLIILAALLLAADATRPRTSEFALYFVLLVDVLAWWVHFNAMRTSSISDTITGVFCGVLCACSWVSLFLYRDSKLI